MEKLADFTLVEPIFKDSGISPNWLFALSRGETKVYNGTQILNFYILNDICVINSGSIKNERYKKSIIKDIIALIKSNKKVIISSEVESISKFLSKYGFSHDKAKNIYKKGF